MVLLFGVGALNESYRCGELALRILEKFPCIELVPRSYAGVYGFLKAIKEPFRDLSGPLEEAYQMHLTTTGDVEVSLVFHLMLECEIRSFSYQCFFRKDDACLWGSKFLLWYFCWSPSVSTHTQNARVPCRLTGIQSNKHPTVVFGFVAICAQSIRAPRDGTSFVADWRCHE